jgi:hypothetical protein
MVRNDARNRHRLLSFWWMLFTAASLHALHAWRRRSHQNARAEYPSSQEAAHDQAAACVSSKESKMNSRLALAAGVAVLFAFAGPAHAQQDTDNMQPMAQQQGTQMQAPAAGTTDDKSSYGGTPSGRSMSSGYRRDSSCIPGLSCNIYQGS